MASDAPTRNEFTLRPARGASILAEKVARPEVQFVNLMVPELVTQFISSCTLPVVRKKFARTTNARDYLLILQRFVLQEKSHIRRPWIFQRSGNRHWALLIPCKGNWSNGLHVLSHTIMYMMNPCDSKSMQKFVDKTYVYLDKHRAF